MCMPSAVAVANRTEEIALIPPRLLISWNGAKSKYFIKFGDCQSFQRCTKKWNKGRLLEESFLIQINRERQCLKLLVGAMCQAHLIEIPRSHAEFRRYLINR